MHYTHVLVLIQQHFFCGFLGDSTLLFLAGCELAVPPLFQAGSLMVFSTSSDAVRAARGRGPPKLDMHPSQWIGLDRWGQKGG